MQPDAARVRERAAPAVSTESPQRGANTEAGPGIGYSPGRPRRSSPSFARATIRRIVCTAAEIRRSVPGMSRAWYIALVKHDYATQGVPVPEDLLLH